MYKYIYISTEEKIGKEMRRRIYLYDLQLSSGYIELTRRSELCIIYIVHP